MRYTADEHGRMVKRVLLDGLEIQDCIIADPDQGFVVCWRRDGHGQLVLKHGHDADKSEIATMTLRGKVHVVLKR